MKQPLSLPLQNKNIMVTRAAHQAATLISLLEQAGASITCLPLIEIVPLNRPEVAINRINRLAQTDIAIFISQNAVNHGMNLIEQHGQLPKQLKLASIGLGSATLLEQRANRAVDIMPLNEYNSEGLLAHSDLQDVKDKNITIFRGMGGRNLLADTLRERGATVNYAEVYERRCPAIDLDGLLTSMQQNPIDFICITSAEGLENLVTSISNKNAAKELATRVFDCQLVIVSQRISCYVEQSGFSKKPIITENVSDKAIVDAIIKNNT